MTILYGLFSVSDRRRRDISEDYPPSISRFVSAVVTLLFFAQCLPYLSAFVRHSNVDNRACNLQRQNVCFLFAFPLGHS